MVASEEHFYQRIVQFDKTMVLPRKPATGSIHDYLFCYCPLVGIPFEVLRIKLSLYQADGGIPWSPTMASILWALVGLIPNSSMLALTINLV